MKVHYVFSRNKKIGSKIIAWAASFEFPYMEIKPSHVAILLDETWILESTLFSGVRVLPYKSWLKINEQLAKVECEKEKAAPEVLSISAEIWGRSYDWAAFAFFVWRYLGLILLGKSLPTVNQLESSNAYLCTEIPAKLMGQNLSMVSPAALYLKLTRK